MMQLKPGKYYLSSFQHRGEARDCALLFKHTKEAQKCLDDVYRRLKSLKPWCTTHVGGPMHVLALHLDALEGLVEECGIDLGISTAPNDPQTWAAWGVYWCVELDKNKHQKLIELDDPERYRDVLERYAVRGIGTYHYRLTSTAPQACIAAYPDGITGHYESVDFNWR